METNENGDVEVAAPSVVKRRKWTQQEQQRIVRAALKPGTSVPEVAQTYGAHASQVYRWRKLYRQGQREAGRGASALLPVQIVESEVKNPRRVPADSKRPATGTIQIELSRGRVFIEGAADPECVRAALERLLG